MSTLHPDIEIIRGDSETIEFELTDNGEAVDLTGSEVFFTAKPALTNDAGDTTAVIKKNVTSHSDPTEGKTQIILTSTDTNVTPGIYYYDIQVKKSGNIITSIKARQLEVLADVTRRIS